MVREFVLPDVGEGVAEGELVSWLVEEGDEVTEDQPVAAVETDKALVEVPAPVDGTVRDRRYDEGDVVPVGDVFVTFDVAGEETADSDDGTSDAALDDENDGPSSDANVVESDGPDAIDDDAAEIEPPRNRVFVPPRARRLARETGIDLSSLEGSGPGGRITPADVRAALDDGTAGVARESRSPETNPASGAESETDDPDSSPDGPVTDPSSVADAADRDRTLAAPATRRIARENGIEIDAVPADDERNGEPIVTPEAVVEYAETQRRAQEADVAALEADAATDVSESGEFVGGERREPFRGVRKRISEAMVESKDSAPHVTHFDEVDVTALVAARDRLKPRATERGIRLTYMPFITKAVVAALEEFPELNAVIDEDEEEIVYREYYNIGVATATDVGLMVPVLENAGEKGLLQLSSEMNELVEKARERSISPDELRGSTFTVTNVGGIGGEYATPILNYPESGILAIGEIKRKPRVVDRDGEESIEPRSVLTLSLSFDHRLVDGAVAARFTNTVMEYLENPELLLLE
ncbi:2-oxo acid dehydrogenase subunit E2 [Natrarchaeobius halalkaliphilus]|uniref:2-oxo acid dehydrogenase subunit E2 n=1 Tax=Natrarchaeobius halalkaliphilus TaxID=1679091 RepID=A0A3N6LWM3_9EURY|nr:dihydrolipoamide acetyltransferase family protein [Natrarchaeobius halalkaliphilus]RQG93267.1 2-oxo acid dehydrogenase subunit E2 [Natrarchaeobius halalkaliphilus]